MSALSNLRQRVGAADQVDVEVAAEVAAEVTPAPAFRRGTTINAVWSKVDDEWFVRTLAGHASVGEVVTITKKDNSESRGRLTERAFSRNGYDYFRAVRVTATGTARRPNRFAGTCRLCGAKVEAEAGVLGPREDGKVTVEHVEGGCQAQAEAEVMAADPEMSDVAAYAEPIWPGIYTIDYETGEHRTLRVTVQRHDADFAPGATIVEYLAGRDNDADYKGFGFVRRGVLQPWKRFRDGHHDLIASAQVLLDNADALHESAVTGEPVEFEGGEILVSKNCIRCGRTLTNPDSNRLGIGPDCSRLGW